MVVRKANQSDIDKIMHLWKEFMSEHASLIEDPRIKEAIDFKDDAPVIFEAFIRNCIKSRRNTIFVADIDSQLVGFSKIQINHNFPIFRTEIIGRITDLYVRKEFRNMSISSELCKSAINWAKDRGAQYISAGLFKENALAHLIYERMGFFDFHVEMRRKA